VLASAFRFDGDFHTRTELEAYIVPVFILQRVFDGYFSKRLIAIFHSDLCFSDSLIWRRDDSSDRSEQCATV
jgi:hypothetical protein